MVEPLAEVRDGEIHAVLGSVLLVVDTIMDPSDGSRHLLTLRSASAIPDAPCWWTARVLDTEPSDPPLFATQSVALEFNPTDSVRAVFATLEPCVNPYDEATRAASNVLRNVCYRPRLYAVSDLNSDARLEYWYGREGADGLTTFVSEATATGGLRRLLQYCCHFACPASPF